MTSVLRHSIRSQVKQGGIRLLEALRALGVAPSSWYRRRTSGKRKRPGPAAKELPVQQEAWVVEMARSNPWYGYKRIAVMCRRARQPVKNREAYQAMKKHGLLQKRRCRKAEVYQAAKLWELLPKKPNELWQMDVTYIHIPGYGWWYAVTVIDYYSRYLLAAHLTSSYSAFEATRALEKARAEAERLCGPLKKRPFLVTDNGPTFMAKRFAAYIRERYAHVRIAYRTPTQLGLLERFHGTLKSEEVYWRLYDSPAHARACLEEFSARYNTKRPHWSLVPAEGGDPLTPQEVYVSERAIRIPKWQGWAREARRRLDEMLGERPRAAS